MITIYSSPTCAKCKMLKDWCEKGKIEYTAVDVTEDAAAQSELTFRGIFSLPAVSINGDFFGGDVRELQKTIQNRPING